MEKKLLTGDEAVARGVYEAGGKFASAYPGTPSTEILENLINYKEVYAEWAPNEKVALEAAIGACWGGVRSIASMKHVGLNVAADPLFTFAYTGVNAGMIIVTADEPGQFSSQNEQDNRYYALSAKIPMVEPSDSQEAIDMVKTAYKVSEDFDTPVLMRMTTRVCHSKSLVEFQDRVEVPDKEYEKNPAKFLMVPAHAIKRRVILEDRMSKLKEYTETTPLNFIEKGGKIGVVVSGGAYQYAKEVFGDSASYLKLGFTNPLPDKLLKEFYSLVDKVYVIEEDDPYLEMWIKANGFAVHGKDTFPAFGEMTPDVIRKSLGYETAEIAPTSQKVVPRPPTLCAGCPHRGLFYDLGKRKDIVVTGDIGCYTLGFAPPYNAIDTSVVMGGAYSNGHGLQKAFDLSEQNKRVIGINGDSTFFHTGINSLIEVIYNGSNVISIIADNRITGMTGQQENPGTGKVAKGTLAPVLDIKEIVQALGFKNVVKVNPNDLTAVKKAFDDALAKDEPSVIITEWPCALKKLDQDEFEEYGQPFTTKYVVAKEVCIGCKMCIKCGCPAISMNQVENKSEINQYQCVGCSVCAQICPVSAIKKVEA